MLSKLLNAATGYFRFGVGVVISLAVVYTVARWVKNVLPASSGVINTLEALAQAR